LVFITPTAYALNQEIRPSSNNGHKNWDDFRHIANERLNLNISLKNEDIEAAVKFFNYTMQWARWNAMRKHADTLKTYDCPISIKQKIGKKKEDCVEVGIDYEHQRARDYLTQEQQQ
jgi:hypothetical protein